MKGLMGRNAWVYGAVIGAWVFLMSTLTLLTTGHGLGGRLVARIAVAGTFGAACALNRTFSRRRTRRWKVVLPGR